MTDPAITPLGRSAPPLQTDVNEALDIRPDALATRSSVPADESRHAAYLATEGVEAALFLAEMAEAPFAVLASPLVTLLGYGLLIEHAFEEGDRRNIELHDDMARGAFAALEGRADSPEVRAEARDNPAFADGIRRVERFSRSHLSEFPRLAAAVKASKRAGMLAVARGQEDSDEFRDRAAVDPAFAHGAHYMRRAGVPGRTTDPRVRERDHGRAGLRTARRTCSRGQGAGAARALTQ